MQRECGPSSARIFPDYLTAPAQHCFKDQDDWPTPGPGLHSTFPAWALGSLRIFYTSSCLGTERKRPGVRRLELKRGTTVQAHHCRAEDKQK